LVVAAVVTAINFLREVLQYPYTCYMLHPLLY
jgi:hypothetical protein